MWLRIWCQMGTTLASHPRVNNVVLSVNKYPGLSPTPPRGAAMASSHLSATLQKLILADEYSDEGKGKKSRGSLAETMEGVYGGGAARIGARPRVNPGLKSELGFDLAALRLFSGGGGTLGASSLRLVLDSLRTPWGRMRSSCSDPRFWNIIKDDMEGADENGEME